MFCLYQNGGMVLGVGESVDQAVEDAEDYLEDVYRPILDALGREAEAEDYTDFSRSAEGTTTLEVEGNLYMRRCSLALFEEARATRNLSHLAYQVGVDGRVRLTTEKMEGSA